MKRILCGCVAVVFVACHGPELDGQTDEHGVVHQAGKTNQGKTNQGKTNQGKTNQGATNTVLVVNRGSFKIRNYPSTSYVTADPKVIGTVLAGTSGSLTYKVNAQNLASDQTLFPLAKFCGQTIDADGNTTSTCLNMRIVNASTDTGSMGDGDAANMLQSQYRDSPPVLASAGIINKGPIGALTGPANWDVRFYRVQVQKENSTQWADVCSTVAGRPANAAIFIPGYFTTSGRYVESYADAQHPISISCWDGTATKCTRWGYKHWKSLTPSNTTTAVSLKPLWEACTHAAMADYCGSGDSYTFEDSTIDIWDKYEFVTKMSENLPWYDSSGNNNAFSDEASFDHSGASCLVRERFIDITGNAACSGNEHFLLGNEYCSQASPLPDGYWSSCGPKGLVGSAVPFDRAQGISSCTPSPAHDKLIFVASYYSSCTHAPSGQGRALALDCNFCTKAVCSDPNYKYCCAEAEDGRLWQTHSLADGSNVPAWDSACVAKAATACNGNSTSVIGGFGQLPADPTP